MAPISAGQPVTSLRTVTQRLSTTPTEELPHVAGILAGFIANDRLAFAQSQKDNHKRLGFEDNVLIHKLKTQITALLQDKSPHARFSALILIKATVEAGGWSILQGVAPWVRDMISILGVS